jgi:hypothetical protein
MALVLTSPPFIDWEESDNFRLLEQSINLYLRSRNLGTFGTLPAPALGEANVTIAEGEVHKEAVTIIAPEITDLYCACLCNITQQAQYDEN